MKLTNLMPWVIMALATAYRTNSTGSHNSTSNSTIPISDGRFPIESNSTERYPVGSNSTERFPTVSNSTGRYPIGSNSTDPKSLYGNGTETNMKNETDYNSTSPLRKLKNLLESKFEKTEQNETAGYGPTKVMCPYNMSMIREANSMSDRESAWVQARHVKTNAAIQNYLSRVGINSTQPVFFDAQNNSRPINIALAFSGGGLRAMLTGAGELAALDNRSALATENGLGGVLQSSTYIAGLSGGSWLLATLIYQDWPTIDEVVHENPYKVWDYSTFNTFLNTSNPIDMMHDFALHDYEQALESLSWWNFPFNRGIKMDLHRKRNAGFPVTVTDAWGRVLAHSLFRKGDNNWQDNATWSGIQDMPMFVNQDMPFPIITALARRPKSIRYNLNSPIVEFNPYEMGSFDKSINTFHDMKYLGSTVTNGSTRDNCYNGYDNVAFVVGTSSSMFNSFLNTMACPNCRGLSKIVKFFARRFLRLLSRHRLDVAWYDPNPFYGSRFAKSESLSTSDTLYLMDGGLAGELIPLSTLAVKERGLDLVFAFDNNGPEWPDGTPLINTYERQFTYEGKSTVFPYVPGHSTFLHHNLTARPTFFGCNANNLTALAKDGVIPPLVIYFANRPYEYFSNTSTMKVTYSDNQKKGMVANGFNIAAQGNHTASPNWQTCVGCAMVRRAEERNNATQSQQCRQCFEQYCWDGTLFEQDPYVAPVNFTANGLTNEPMELDTHNRYIHEQSLVRAVGEKFLPPFMSTGNGWLKGKKISGKKIVKGLLSKIKKNG